MVAPSIMMEAGAANKRGRFAAFVPLFIFITRRLLNEIDVETNRNGTPGRDIGDDDGLFFVGTVGATG
ncbi:hypothetical protein C8J48_3416 [Desmospora activa DSM 45169]|uniref:Uncharacterized protein n=1 Tax=Desmospora activa DSM 45169 TaxID=1121389 RepID=A0A2T4Z1W6_9BACL|nr:hypothetical protein C8J48_3416 [Desmospora activa DSM 45169]